MHARKVGRRGKMHKGRFHYVQEYSEQSYFYFVESVYCKHGQNSFRHLTLYTSLYVEFPFKARDLEIPLI